MNLRVGIGYDVHQLVTGRRLVLGGVEIPSTRGLLGHSDADVLLHAVMDALLGAAGLPDIGSHFPNTDPRYKDSNSLELLRQVRTLLHTHGWAIGNIDVSIIAEQPKLAPHLPRMRERIAHALEIAPQQIGLKATTNETIGFVGRGEGIAAVAVALLQGVGELG